MKVLLLNGSPHANGCTYTALCETARALQNNGNIDFNISVRVEDDGVLLNDWTRVSGVDCGTGAKSLTVKASASSGAVIKVCTGSQNGTAVSYVEIPAGGSMQEITVPVVGLSGTQDLYFVFSGNVSFDSWVLSK